MKYTENKDIKKLIDKELIDRELTKVEIAEKMGCKKQMLNNILNKKNLAFSDIARICDAMGCDLYVDIREKEVSET